MKTDLTLKDFLFQWKTIPVIIISIGLFCWWNSWGTYFELSAQSSRRMIYVSAFCGCLFWGIFFYMKINWQPPREWESLRPKEAVGLLAALAVGLASVVIIRAVLSGVPIPAFIQRQTWRPGGSPSPSTQENFFIFYRFVLVFYPATELLKERKIFRFK